ncbi:MAG: hypothetical protein ACFFG0_36825 [Candidatus Thorarchaeota archaeon]
MFFGASLVMGYSAIGLFKSSFKIHKVFLRNIISEDLPSDYYESSLIAYSINFIVAENIREAVEDSIWGDLPNTFIDGYVDENGKYHELEYRKEPFDLTPTPSQCCGAAIAPKASKLLLDDNNLLLLHNRYRLDLVSVTIDIFSELMLWLERYSSNGVTDSLKFLSKGIRNYLKGLTQRFDRKDLPRILNTKIFEKLLAEVQKRSEEAIKETDNINIKILNNILTHELTTIVKGFIDFSKFYGYRVVPVKDLRLTTTGQLKRRVVLIENIRYKFPKLRGLPISDYHLAPMLLDEPYFNKFLTYSEKIELRELFMIDYNVMKLKVKDFKKIGLDISEDALVKLKVDVAETIFNYFYTSGLYITESDMDIGPNYCRIKYSMIRSLAFYFTEQLGSGKFVSFREISKFVKSKVPIKASLSVYFTEGRDMTPNTIQLYQRLISSMKRTDHRYNALIALKEYENLDTFTLRSKVGVRSHPIYEFYTKAYFHQQGLSVTHENAVITGTGTRPDNTIERNKEFITKIELPRREFFKKILGSDNLGKISVINIDFTIARDVDNIVKKLWKSYQAENQLLLIVLFGPVSTVELDNFKKAINSYKPNSGPGSYWIDNVHLISFKQFCELFGISEVFIQKCNARFGLDPTIAFDDLITNILDRSPPARDPYLDRLLMLSDRAKFLLDNWNQKLLKELI